MLMFMEHSSLGEGSLEVVSPGSSGAISLYDATVSTLSTREGSVSGEVQVSGNELYFIEKDPPGIRGGVLKLGNLREPQGALRLRNIVLEPYVTLKWEDAESGALSPKLELSATFEELTNNRSSVARAWRSNIRRGKLRLAQELVMKDYQYDSSNGRLARFRLGFGGFKITSVEIREGEMFAFGITNHWRATPTPQEL